MVRSYEGSRKRYDEEFHREALELIREGLGHLLRIAGLAGPTYFRHLSHSEHVTRPDLEPLIKEVWGRTANECGHRQVRMCLAHEFRQRVSAKTMPEVMRRMEPKMRDPHREPMEALQLVPGRERRPCAQPPQT